MKRVLIVGPIWQYHGGGARLHGLARYLPECGWEPVVLTRPLPLGVTLPYRAETPGGDMVGARVAQRLQLDGEGGPRSRLARKLHVSSENRLLRWGCARAREVLEYPDGCHEWRRAALRRALQLVRDERYDAIVSTSPPVSCHLIAAEVKRQYGLTWVADFPHLWSQDHGAPAGLRHRFDQRLELCTLARADALVTTNPVHASRFGVLHGGGRIHVICHGYDPQQVNEPPVPLDDTFTLTYTGGLTRGVREPQVVLQGLELLLRPGLCDRTRVRVSLYGPVCDWVDAQIAGTGLQGVVVQHGVVPQTTAFEVQRRAHVLLNIKCDYGFNVGILSSKVLEYLAARRPVISVGTGVDVADQVLADTGAGVVAEDAEAVADTVGRMYQEWCRTEDLPWWGKREVVEKYTQRAMADAFAALLESPAKES